MGSVARYVTFCNPCPTVTEDAYGWKGDKASEFLGAARRFQTRRPAGRVDVEETGVSGRAESGSAAQVRTPRAAMAARHGSALHHRRYRHAPILSGHDRHGRARCAADPRFAFTSARTLV